MTKNTNDHKKDAKNDRHYRLGVKRFWASVANTTLLLGTLIVAGVAANFAYNSYLAALKQVAAANREADAAWKQVQAAQDISRIETRAYVYARPRRVFHVMEGESALQSYVSFGNSGQTFATDVESRVGLVVSGPVVPDRIDDLGWLEPEKGVAIITPNFEIDIIRNREPLKAEQIRQIRTFDGKSRIYVFGTISYNDVYGKPHTTVFCFTYFSSENTIVNGNGNRLSFYEGWQARYCDKHNYAD